MKSLTLALIAAFAVSGVARADEPEEASTTKPTEAPATQGVADGAGAPAILTALDLPMQAQAARDAGVPPDEVRMALEAADQRGVPADEATAVLASTAAIVEEKGPIDNFAAFVTTQLDEGKRGTDLAAAIHAEHEAHGKGRGVGKPDKDAEHGRAAEHRQAAEHGKPDKDAEHGRSAGHGKPDMDDEHGEATEHGPPPGKGKSTHADKEH